MFETNTTETIGRLTQARFVFHVWQNLPILGPDGVLFHLDTKALDVDGENLIDGKSGGVAYIKRLRLVPVTATQKAFIDNKEGFAVSNMFIGSLGQDGQPVGLGSNMSGSIKTNVKSEWHYPDQKLSDMVYTFGKYGLIAIRSLAVDDPKSYAQAQKVFSVVMSGVNDKTLLEDMPEYFGEISPYLPDKKPARFRHTAQEIIELAATEGVTVNGQNIKLTATEYTNALALAEELPPSILQAHIAALDPEANGILAQTQEGIQTGQKRSYDKCDRWLMGQFPSYPMDTELEKSQKQLIKALEPDQPAEAQALEGFVAAEEFEAEKQRNDQLEERLNKLEQAQTVAK